MEPEQWNGLELYIFSHAAVKVIFILIVPMCNCILNNLLCPQMLAFVVLPALLALASAAPGGYTGYGGMYKNMQMHPETMHHAKMAANMAKKFAFEQDESLRAAPGVRPSRSSQYVPTFFTSEPQPIITNPGPGLVRSSRRASQGPLYYNTYRMPAKVTVMRIMVMVMVTD